jgi:hypothetical protein
VAWPAPEVQDLTDRHAPREPVEKRPIERLSFELAIDALGVLGSEEVVSGGR